jgi:hypothetical protein
MEKAANTAVGRKVLSEIEDCTLDYVSAQTVPDPEQ